MQSLVKTSLPQSAFTCSKLIEALEQHLVLVFLLLNLNCDVSLFYVLYSSSLKKVGCGLRKSPLFSATLTYLTFKKKKNYFALFYM